MKRNRTSIHHPHPQQHITGEKTAPNPNRYGPTRPIAGTRALSASTQQRPPSQLRGAFLLFEGPDRAGKSTHAKHLTEVLNHHGRPSVYMNFPNRTTPSGQTINDFLQNKITLSEQDIHVLFSKNRLEMKDQMITTLLSGKNIILDRYSYSGAAFSAAKKCPGMDLQWCFSHEIGLPAPDIVFFMDCPPHVAQTRGGYGEERFENVLFQQQVYHEFQTMIRHSPSWETVQNTLHAHPSPVTDSETSPIATKTHYIAPWTRIDSQREFTDVHQDVLRASQQVIDTVQHSPLFLICPFIPQHAM